MHCKSIFNLVSDHVQPYMKLNDDKLKLIEEWFVGRGKLNFEILPHALIKTNTIFSLFTL